MITGALYGQQHLTFFYSNSLLALVMELAFERLHGQFDIACAVCPAADEVI